MKPQVELGTRYYSGDGVPHIFVEAVKWRRLAAEQGVAGRQCCFCVVYDTWHGVLQHMVVACVRFSVATAGGFANALAERDRSAGKLSAEN